MLLDVGDGHTVYYSEHGSPTGKPVVVLHGGPGGGIQPKVLTFFNLKRWRIIMFDQRGCGKSTLNGKNRDPLFKNTTWDLVADIERIRTECRIDRWVVFGGSWGTTLALAYADKHMNRISGFVLRGVSLMEPWENQWLYSPNGAARLFPEAWNTLTGVGVSNRKNKSKIKNPANLFRTFKSAIRTKHGSAKAWCEWESTLSSLTKKNKSVKTDSDKTIQSMALLEVHYFSHNAWIRPGQLLKVAARIPRSIPVHIIQGRYDMVCPPFSAFQVAQHAKHAKLVMTIAGHSAFDRENAVALHKSLASLV
jgi:proline iminopeptidase